MGPLTKAVLLLVFGLARPAMAAELQPRTAAAFDRYVAVTEARMDALRAFLHMDGLELAERTRTLGALRRGELVIQPLATREGTRAIEAPDGLIHHWLGAVFVPGADLAAAVALLQNYDAHAEIYTPRVARSRLLARTGDRFRIHLRFVMQKVITVVVNSEHEAVFSTPAPDRVEGRIHSTRIAEVEHAGTPQEREKPVGMDGGYLWRLNTYWRLERRDGGVYIECESISLSRGIPVGFGWVIRPFVTGIPRESLVFTLETTRRRLAKDAGP